MIPVWSPANPSRRKRIQSRPSRSLWNCWIPFFPSSGRQPHQNCAEQPVSVELFRYVSAFKSPQYVILCGIVPANAQIAAGGCWCSASGRQVHISFLEKRHFELAVTWHDPLDSLHAFVVIWSDNTSQGREAFANIRSPDPFFETLAQ
jgi:hypothetical protein